jgi:OmpA-OmpF porin, OOP family
VYKSNVTRCHIALWVAALAATVVSSPAVAQIEAEFKDEFDAQAEAGGAAPAGTASVQTAGAAGVAVETGDAEAQPEAREAQRLRASNSWYGSAGGFHIVDAAAGPSGTFRLQLGMDAFTGSDFMIVGDGNDSMGATLSLGWTVIEPLELYAAFANHANYNTAENPALLQVFGDAVLGAKVWADVEPWFYLGGDLRFVVLNAVGDIGPVLSAMSYGLRFNATADLRQIEEPVPLIVRFNLDYLFDNSANLIEDVEDRRYRALGPDADMLTFGLGFELPLRAAQDFYVHPLLEWTLGVPVNRQGYSCLLVPGGAGRADPDGCLEIEGLAAMPSVLTLGARMFPPVRGLSFGLGLDVGLSGTSTFVRELVATRPWAFLLTVGYAVDPRPRPAQVREVEIVREVAKPEPPRPRVQGEVVDSSTSGPVAGAVIRYPGRELSAQQSDAQGRFVSYELAPGEVQFEVGHPDYETRTCVAVLPSPSLGRPAAPAAPGQPEPAPEQDARPATNPYLYGGSGAPRGGAAAESALVSMRCELTAKPRAGSMRGLVRAEGGEPIANARVQLTGPSSQELASDGQGQFSAENLAAGSYSARVEADGYLIKLTAVEIAPGQLASPEITLAPKPKQSQVELTKQEVRIRKEIFFKTNSAEISEKSSGLLSEIADVLLRNPQVTLIEIQGHTDATGTAEGNLQLSQQRADSVRQALIDAGVDGSRMVTKGYGDTRPLVPNLTERHRARNRRVQFIIREQL